MQRTVFSIIVTFAVWSLAIAGNSWAEEGGKVTQEKTAHLVIEYDPSKVSEDAVRMAKRDGEKYYTMLSEMLGYEPEGKIVILLRGYAEQPDGSWGYPHVDSFRRVHLFRFTDDDHSYFNALAHEMVHVFRFQRKPHHSWFLEEGFAEFVALRVDPSLGGFPWFDYPVVIAAGQWFVAGEDIPLQQLRDAHKKLNLPCKAQSYTLRSAFFDYLGNAYGDDKVHALAQQEKAGGVDDYEKFFGKDFDTLAAEFENDLLEAYAATENAEELSRRYREDSPLKYSPVCKKGKEF